MVRFVLALRYLLRSELSRNNRSYSFSWHMQCFIRSTTMSAIITAASTFAKVLEDLGGMDSTTETQRAQGVHRRGAENAEKTTAWPHMLAKISRNCTLVAQRKESGHKDQLETPKTHTRVVRVVDQQRPVTNRDLSLSFVCSFNCFSPRPLRLCGERVRENSGLASNACQNFKKLHVISS
jgi:hypothetical protein